ncbi:MAG TPA: hypothetical protein VGP05_17680 [Pseudonocardia sp.]|jgi:hypothetical protein|nr:hypothetical protein [Pseudonocardia sp.]
MSTTESKSSPRQDRRKARTRARILDGAEEFFASADPESATYDSELPPATKLIDAAGAYLRFNSVIGLALRPDRLRLPEPELLTALAQRVEIVLDGLVGEPLRGDDGHLAPELRRRLHTALGS